MKKKKITLYIGIAGIIAGFIWMLLSQSSVGPFLILGGAGGALIADGIRKNDE